MPNPETIQRIQETVIRHRFEEAALLVAAASRLLADVPRIAGPTNGIAKTADARSADALTLAQTLDANWRDHRRKSGVEISERVADEDQLEEVLAAKAREAQAS